MKAYFKSLKVKGEKFARIQRELDHSETKRSEIKRVLMRFNREQMLGYRLEQAPVAPALKLAPIDLDDDFTPRLELKRNEALMIAMDTKNVLKELTSKYCPLYDLKMTSAIEDIDPKFSLAEIAKVDKVEHAIKVEKDKANAYLVAR